MKTIASERVRVGMTQDELADKLDVARPTVISWEMGKTDPSVSMLVTMADLFGCSADYLLGRTEERL